jgi:hypothetical protein
MSHASLPRRDAPVERKRVTRYLINIYQPDGPLPEPAKLAPVMHEIAVIRDQIEAAGMWVFGAGLHAPSTATVIRAKGEDVLLTDGPFLEGKEHVGGFMIIDAGDLDEALEWGLRYARATGLPIEVRPFQGELPH